MIDLLVVGGGPVGLVTAIHAARAGLEVSVIEPRTGDIDKACGEGLMPEAVRHLAALGIDPPGMDFHGIRYISGNRKAEALFSHGSGRGVRRTTLHVSLHELARAEKIKFINGKVDTIEQKQFWVEAGGIRSRYLVGADGLHSTVREQLKLGIPNESTPNSRFGLRQHFHIAPWSDLVEVYWVKNAEIYVTPTNSQTVGIVVLGKSRVNFNEVVSHIPALTQLLERAESVSKLRGAGPLRQRVRARSVGRVLLVGDAAGYVDALTGEGLQVGFAEAQAAVSAVVADDLSGYEAEWQRITRSYRWLTGGLLWASSNRMVRPVIVPAAQVMPHVFNRLVNTLN
ncbi:MAG: FAD-dependent monooxygenase [Candidatus Planktophila sp.]|nr:FAD-dependent monooxygenase [Candidatus Planktophila sp.]